MSQFTTEQASKFVVAVLAALGEASRTGHFDWKTLVAGLIGAVAVYLVPNATAPVQPPAAGQEKGQPGVRM